MYIEKHVTLHELVLFLMISSWYIYYNYIYLHLLRHSFVHAVNVCLITYGLAYVSISWYAFYQLLCQHMQIFLDASFDDPNVAKHPDERRNFYIHKSRVEDDMKTRLDLQKVHMFIHFGNQTDHLLPQWFLNDGNNMRFVSLICWVKIPSRTIQAFKLSNKIHEKILLDFTQTLRLLDVFQASNQSQSIKTPRSSSLCWKWSLTSNNMLSSLEVNPPLVI